MNIKQVVFLLVVAFTNFSSALLSSEQSEVESVTKLTISDDLTPEIVDHVIKLFQKRLTDPDEGKFFSFKYYSGLLHLITAIEAQESPLGKTLLSYLGVPDRETFNGTTYEIYPYIGREDLHWIEETIEPGIQQQAGLLKNYYFHGTCSLREILSSGELKPGPDKHDSRPMGVYVANLYMAMRYAVDPYFDRRGYYRQSVPPTFGLLTLYLESKKWPFYEFPDEISRYGSEEVITTPISLTKTSALKGLILKDKEQMKDIFSCMEGQTQHVVQHMLANGGKIFGNFVHPLCNKQVFFLWTTTLQERFSELKKDSPLYSFIKSEIEIAHKYEE